MYQGFYATFLVRESDDKSDILLALCIITVSLPLYLYFEVFSQTEITEIPQKEISEIDKTLIQNEGHREDKVVKHFICISGRYKLIFKSLMPLSVVFIIYFLSDLP